ncbi:S66 peptidase family protein [Jatrophihabitans sp. YIM 134969]
MTAPLRRSPLLRPGDRVAIVAPSGVVLPDRLAAAVDRLRGAGFEVVVFPSVYDGGSARPYLAGSDAGRAADLTNALLDDDIRAVFCARGGYGAHRAVDLVDWPRLARVEPKHVVGFSDVTALHEALAVHLGWVSLHGPCVASNVPPDDVSWRSLLDALMAPPTLMTFPGARPLQRGTDTGVTLGGNLTVLAASIGTPTSRSADAGILLLEDVGETAYRVDRMLTQLRRSGYLDGVAGIVGGSWRGCDGVEDVLAERLGDLGVPVLLGAPFGHEPPNLTVPLGVTATLDVDARTLTFPG